MIAAIVLAACLLPPLFDMSGPPCVDQSIECRCSECFRWDPVGSVATRDAATWYEVLRRNPDGTSQNVGRTAIYGGYTDDDGTVIPADPQELWCFAKDPTIPVEGLTYTYARRACNPIGCAAWSDQMGVTITYVAAPYRVWP